MNAESYERNRLTRLSIYAPSRISERYKFEDGKVKEKD